MLAIGWKNVNKKIEFTNYNKYIYIYIYICYSLIIFSLIACYKTKDNIVTNILANSQKYLTDYQAFEEQVKHRKNNIAALKIKNIESTGVFVLVIGESQNRDNMHAYGYSRQNTPWLSSVKDSNNILFFKRAYSCHTHTVPVLTYALTSKNQYNNNSLAKSASLLEMAELAGYETVWISNQVKYGAWDTPISVIANEANQQFWYNDNRGESLLTNFHDEKLMDAFKNLKIKEKMLIVVHLMGNHGAYDNRYPKEFNKYGNDNNLNKYDNSILYNDYVVKNIFDNVRRLPNFQGMIYFADHADAVQQGLSHDASQYVPAMTHIPMYMFFSNRYIDSHKEQFSNLKKAESKMFTNDLVYNYMLSILGIHDETSYEDTNDLTNANYNSKESRFRTLHGVRELM